VTQRRRLRRGGRGVLIQRRRAEPQDDDLVSVMVAAIDNESVSNVEISIVAGNETSTNLIGNTVVEAPVSPRSEATYCSTIPDCCPTQSTKSIG
jgi:cytochrome P450